MNHAAPTVLPLEDADVRRATTTDPDEAGLGALTTEHGNLPLRRLDLRVTTTGLAARMVLTQGFTNPYAEPLEATYVFPLPDRAAVSALRMTADERTVDGVLREREQARATYDAAVAEGKRASIAEEDRPGVFTMRVGNILPGEEVTCELTLDGPLAYADGEATFHFPLVVAPRYVPGTPVPGAQTGAGVQPDTDAVPDASRITPPVLLPGFPNPIQLGIEVEVDPAGLPLRGVRSSLHAIEQETLDEAAGRLRARIHPGERVDRDFILRLALADPDAVRGGLTLAPDDEDQLSDDQTDCGDGTFTVTVVPPADLRPARPRDVVCVLDRSGSMSGAKIVTARRAAARMLDSLGPDDRFAVLGFDTVVETPPRLPDGLVDASDRHRFRAVEYLGSLDARGGTEMLEPLRRAADLLTGEEGREQTIVLVTDGQVGNEDQILAELADRLGGVRIHTVGIDVAVNSGFLHRLAALGRGRYELVESEDRLDEAMENIHRRIGTPLLTDLELSCDGFEPVAGTVTPSPTPAVYAGVPLVLTGRYTAASSESPAVTVTGQTPDGTERSIRLTAGQSANPALTTIWARGHLRDLEDRYVALPRGRVSASGGSAAEAKRLERTIVERSLRFGVLCRFTAFVAVDSRVVTDGTTPRRVAQPVELPQGWTPPTPPPAGGVRTMLAGGPGGSARTARFAGGPKMTAGTASSDAGSPSPAPDGLAGGPVGAGLMAGGSIAGAPTRRPRPVPGPEPAELVRARARAAAELDRLASLPTEDRAEALRALPGWLEELVASLAATVDGPLLRPLRALAADLPGQRGRAIELGEAELHRVWVGALDVLEMFATPPGAAPDRDSPAPRGPAPRRPSGPFWKR